MTLPNELGIDPLLGLAEELEESTGGLMGLGSDLSTILDPALLASLGELGLSEDLGVTGALEDSVRLLLNAGEQRRRLKRGFEREQELTGADLSGRGIPILAGQSNEQGLVADVARQLGEQQGEQLSDFNAGVGDQFRGIVSGLGNEQLGNTGQIGNTLLQGILGNLQGGLDQKQDEIKMIGS